MMLVLQVNAKVEKEKKMSFMLKLKCKVSICHRGWKQATSVSGAASPSQLYLEASNFVQDQVSGGVLFSYGVF